MERYPYYSANATDEELERATADVESVIRRIDAAALEPNRYWSTFIDDMAIGDLATEDILALDPWRNR